MTRILSWDVGIKNLAYCIIEESIAQDSGQTNLHIIDWDVYNISPEDKCDYVSKVACIKSASFHCATSNLFFCSAHIKKYQIDNPDEKFKKIVLGKDHFFARNCRLPEILDTRRDLFLSCEHVVIENQPILKNPVMKTIQMILYSYFLLRGITDKEVNQSRTESIQCYSATNKLKANGQELNNLTISTKDYKDRKKASIDMVKQLVVGTPNHAAFFAGHKKKDDLADCFLQAIAYRRFYMGHSTTFVLLDKEV
jgi:hypothetical protein